MQTSDGVTERVAAMCENCSTVFASEVRNDGTIHPIGTKKGCTCGSAEFRQLT